MSENTKELITALGLMTILCLIGFLGGALYISHANVRQARESYEEARKKYPEAACMVDIMNDVKIADLPAKCLQYMEFPDRIQYYE